MVTSVWQSVSRSMGGEILKMKKMIPFYSYADERSAVLTDKKFCSILRDELVKSKSLFSDALDWMYKSRLESMYLERQKDDFDILLDEIEVKVNRWDERIPKEFLEKIIDYDVMLMEKAGRLQEDLRVLIAALQEIGRQNTPGKPAVDRIKISADVVIEKVDEITEKFKEREAAFDINMLGLRDTFERIRKKIRGAV